ncbi:MAG: hypothetical protein HN348_08140 [Proteobacteria bacterium]|nr:hypothetical protein [Pseudomonadota bacterium]
MIALLLPLVALAQDPVDTPGTPISDAEPLESTAVPPPPPPELWAGRIAVFGIRKIPFLGKVEFRTDNYLLSEVTRADGMVSLEQKVCKIVFEKAAGAAVSMDPKGLLNMPKAYPVFHQNQEDRWNAPPWPSGWGEEDLDQNDRPGISVRVKAPFCGGELHVAAAAMSTAKTVPMNGALGGRIDIFTEQRVLGASGACLTLLAKDHAQWMDGRVAYFPVPAGTTCETVPESAWPDPMDVVPEFPKEGPPP